MTGFTSTTMTSLLVEAFRAIDPDLVDGIARPDPMKGALASTAEKGALLQSFVDAHGPGALLQVGQFLDRVEDSPIATVLTRSRDPSVLAAKWMRLEKYLHSDHRTEIRHDVPGRWCCRRLSGEGAPGVAENYLIAGVLLGLLQWIGAQDCRLHIGKEHWSPGRFQTVSDSGPAESFAIVWTRDQRPGAPLEPAKEALTDRLAALLSSDIGRSWRLPDAARLLGYSERSLQRHLRHSGRGFTSILRRARMHEAARLLLDTETTCAEVGYCCGYADQAHFQRDFLKVTNMTPRVYRSVAAEGQKAPDDWFGPS